MSISSLTQHVEDLFDPPRAFFQKAANQGKLDDRFPDAGVNEPVAFEKPAPVTVSHIRMYDCVGLFELHAGHVDAPYVVAPLHDTDNALVLKGRHDCRIHRNCNNDIGTHGPGEIHGYWYRDGTVSQESGLMRLGREKCGNERAPSYGSPDVAFSYKQCFS
jgi:hypothetical protein